VPQFERRLRITLVPLAFALWPAIEAASNWIDGPGDPDGDGFVEYKRATEQGLANQGWKDSHDAIFHADGRLAEGNIALAEVQGYVYAAKRAAARVAQRLGHEALALKLDAEATRLAERFEAAFWCPEIETYALALDGAKKSLSRTHVEFRSGSVQRYCRFRSRRMRCHGTDAAALLLRLGNSHLGERRSPIQSDVVSQRICLAA
jgi:glycogen debranching enzyme